MDGYLYHVIFVIFCTISILNIIKRMFLIRFLFHILPSVSIFVNSLDSILDFRMFNCVLSLCNAIHLLSNIRTMFVLCFNFPSVLMISHQPVTFGYDVTKNLMPFLCSLISKNRGLILVLMCRFLLMKQCKKLVPSLQELNNILR